MKLVLFAINLPSKTTIENLTARRLMEKRKRTGRISAMVWRGEERRWGWERQEARAML
jgi:hypothetical protein